MKLHGWLLSKFNNVLYFHNMASERNTFTNLVQQNWFNTIDLDEQDRIYSILTNS